LKNNFAPVARSAILQNQESLPKTDALQEPLLEKNLYRHELKYLINYGDKELLCTKLNSLMKKDTNVLDGKYKVRSLYFDDYYHSAYEEKIQGLYARQKYRIRIYNDDDSVIRLECKIKRGSFISKKSALLTREETGWILDGKYDFLLKKENPLFHEFYFQCATNVMRPCVIVDYEREPYVYRAGDVRITFDTDIRSAMLNNDFFRSDLSCIYAIEYDKMVLEVKFTEFLPKIIQQVLPLRSSELVAFSKFTACLEASAAFHAISNNSI